jgi:hypothetical protein
MAELDRELILLGRRLEWPPEPQLAARVRARLGEEPRRAFPWRRTLVIALAVLAVAVAATFAVPSARTAVLRWLGLEHVRVVEVDHLPPTRKLSEADLGRKTTLARAATAAGFDPLTLRTRPDAVYVARTDGSARVTLVYGSVGKPRLLVSEFRGIGVTKFVEKLYGSGTRVEPVHVRSAPGLWLSGAPHAVYYASPENFDVIQINPPLLAGNTLVWERSDDLVVRLEGDLTKVEALELAKSLR